MGSILYTGVPLFMQTTQYTVLRNIVFWVNLCSGISYSGLICTLYSGLICALYLKQGSLYDST